MATAPWNQSRVYDTRMHMWRAVTKAPNVAKKSGPIDYWMPLCDGCALPRDSEWTFSSLAWRLNLVPRKGVRYHGYMRPFRNDKWDGYRCYECMQHYWPELDEMLLPTRCPACLECYQWK